MKPKVIHLNGMLPLSDSEHETTEGGFIPLLFLAAGALFLSSCGSNATNAQSNQNSSQINVNCSRCSVSVTPVK